MSPSYTNPALAQFFVTFLGTLPHGSELARLKLAIETPAEVVSGCGGDDGVLACYLPTSRTMIVPGEQAQGSDAPVNYVIAHEYGHHLAAARSNAPLAAVTYGPKYWSSYERVCSRTSDGQLAVSQTTRYLEDPGRGLGGDLRAADLPRAPVELHDPAGAGRRRLRRGAPRRLPPVDEAAHAHLARAALGDAPQPQLPAAADPRRRAELPAARPPGQRLRPRPALVGRQRGPGRRPAAAPTAWPSGSRAATGWRRTCD